MGNGMLSQEEIDALLRGTMTPEPSAEEPVVEFTEMEKDAIGEIANISMGTAATTLSQLLGKKVDITTPKVDVTNAEQVRKDYPIPSVIVDVKYKAGIEGSNFLILSQRDGSVIVDMMMGGDGKNPSPELSELQISGISEAMNQMMGSAATSMSTMFNSMVDITPPQLVLNDLGEENHEFFPPNEPLIRISFRMVVEDVIDSILIQVIPVSVAKGMVSKLMGTIEAPASVAPAKAQSQPKVQPQPVQPQPVQTQPVQPRTQTMMPSSPPPQPNYPPTSVQPAQFAPLRPTNLTVSQDNLGLILDVPLQVSVELGKAKKTIKEILELGPGSVIELDRLAGEPVDMIVNGKLVAKCEVVVINETFGIRITDIVQPSERMTSIQ
ncbi:flagellar motor switch phosphatase FliY [Desulfitobacterium metallireducens]|uniref:Flagellar motor switch protein FliN n=1 Tax=Desulfitobacterium metallireducens DSM 15288 TaxID=871968 RepID=W0EFE3_9FIRM|nr:flagellar motor switch phosphatase FliY [Desulfitobacterium metallireducens]AHF07781.1 flagellar motor switch protein FliN [Desulfitobacterium metallireducens DSM 15288]